MLRLISWCIGFLLLGAFGVYGQSLRVPAIALKGAGDLDTLIRAIGDARIIVLGEGAHGGSEYHLWRKLITERLVRERGFRCIAVEGEWADCFRVNQFIRGSSGDSMSAVQVLQGFERWPSWAWGNVETLGLLRWLQAENKWRNAREQIGFYGLDLYDIWESVAGLAQVTDGGDTALRGAVLRAYACMQPYGPDAMRYGALVNRGDKGCAAAAARPWELLRARYAGKQRTELDFAREQYALVAYNGERYFRNIYQNVVSWNMREQHMLHTVQRLLEYYGEGSKIIIWAHNTHVGDARASSMSTRRKLSLGQLLRQAYGEEQVFLLGMGAYEGSVLSGWKWGDSIRVSRVPPARGDSWEYLLHKQGGGDQLVINRALREVVGVNGNFATRSIGAVYRPESDAYSTYTTSNMVRRFDAYLYVERVRELQPLKVKGE